MAQQNNKEENRLSTPLVKALVVGFGVTTMFLIIGEVVISLAADIYNAMVSILLGLVTAFVIYERYINIMLVTHDSLTGLANKRLLEEHLELAISRARRSGDNFTLFYINLNGFKSINDTYGHKAGDTALKEISNRLLSRLRGEDVVARLEEDRFVVIGTGIHDKEDAEHFQVKLSGIINEPIEYRANEFSVSASIGAAIYPHDGETLPKLLFMADRNITAHKEGA